MRRRSRATCKASARRSRTRPPASLFRSAPKCRGSDLELPGAVGAQLPLGDHAAQPADEGRAVDLDAMQARERLVVPVDMRVAMDEHEAALSPLGVSGEHAAKALEAVRRVMQKGV